MLAVAVRPEVGPAGAALEGAAREAVRKVGCGGAEAAAGGGDRRRVARGRPAAGEDLDHAAERRVAVERGRGSAERFDSLDVGRADAPPVHDPRLDVLDGHPVDAQLHVLGLAAAEEAA